MAKYKAHVSPLLDDGEVIYDKTYNETFHQQLEPIQYNAYLDLSRAIRGSPSEKHYQELVLESLQRRQMCRNIAYFIRFLKVINQFNPKPKNFLIMIPEICIRLLYFENSIFQSTVIEQNP